MKGLFITGTDTNVGKTYIACQIAAGLNAQGIKVSPRKPVESGCKLVNGILHPRDASLLLKASLSDNTLQDVCRYRFAAAVSPQLAAREAQQTLHIKDLVEACNDKIKSDDFLLVEGAGGFYSPICENSLNADLAKELNLPIILVVDDRLGGVNQALLTIRAIEDYGLNIAAIILNNLSPNNQHNLMKNKSEIESFTHHRIFKIAFNQHFDPSFFSNVLIKKFL